jgi:hypothetical protein
LARCSSCSPHEFFPLDSERGKGIPARRLFVAREDTPRRKVEPLPAGEILLTIFVSVKDENPDESDGKNEEDEDGGHNIFPHLPHL